MPKDPSASKSPPKYEDIARAAGVGKATVFRALNNRPRISEATRERVLNIADELGYQRNPLVSAHMEHVRATSSKRPVLTMGYLWERDERVILPKDEAIYQGARAHALRKGFQLELLNPAAPDMTDRRLSDILYHRGIDGLVLAPLAKMRQDQMDINWDRFAVAAVGYSVWSPLEIHRAYSDDYSIMWRLLERLTERGYQRIGFALLPTADKVVNYMWTAALLRYQQELPARRRVPYFSPSELTRENFQAWIESKRPDVVIGVAGKTLDWLRSFAKVPQEIGWATVFWQEQWHEASGYDQNFEQMGASAVDLMVNQLNLGERGLPKHAQTVLLKGMWKEGTTLLR